MLGSHAMGQPMRVVGRRSPPPAGELPDARARQAMTQMAQYRTRAPKGVFHYKDHEEANRDRDRWLTEAIVAKQGEG